MCVNDGGDEAGEAGLDFGAAGCVVHLDAEALAADEAGLAEGLEMLGEGGFGDVLLAEVQEMGTGLGAGGADDLGVDGDADGVGEGVEDPLDGDIVDGGVEKGFH